MATEKRYWLNRVHRKYKIQVYFRIRFAVDVPFVVKKRGEKKEIKESYINRIQKNKIQLYFRIIFFAVCILKKRRGQEGEQEGRLRFLSYRGE